MMNIKNTIYILLLCASPFVSCQIKGNSTSISRKNIMYSEELSNANIYDKNIQQFRHQNLVPNPIMTIDVKVLNNVIADSYTAVFNLTQIGKTSEETNNLMSKRIANVKRQLLAQGILEKDFVIDVISFIPVYETVIERKLFSTEYNEVPNGFELQQNIHIKFTKVDQFKKILSACANNEIYNLVKVDYFIDDIQSVYKKLRVEILNVLKEKKQFYNDLGFDLSAYTPTIADTKYCYFPKEFYKNYKAFNSISIEAINKKEGVMKAKKQTSYYYDPISYKAYDLVLNASIVEPVIQMGMEIKLQYSPKTKEITEKEIIKNKYFMVSNEGAITVKELKLDN